MSVSYVVNGKIYTSYPLMDEIVFNCKLILDGIVVKNEYVAHNFEDETTLYDQEVLFKCKNQSYIFETLPINYDMLIAFGYNNEEAKQYMKDKDTIPEEDRDSLVVFGMQYLIETYEEKNKYYRSLMGLPEYGTDRYNYYIAPTDLPSDFEISSVDFTLPIHEQPSIVISALRSNGRMNEIIEANRSFNYSYLRFLDDLALDPYVCRKAGKWDILYIPDANELVKSRFQEIYEIDKQIYLKNAYQTAYAFRSEYYDHMLIFMLLCQTLTDMVSDTPEWYIRKDIFDIRTVQFFLESYGIPFYEQIPLKYQIRIVKNLNNLIKYKSTQRNFEDIINIFNLRETNIYTYYLYKKRKTDSQGHYIEDPDLEKMYDLLFIEVILGDTYDNYIKNLNYRNPYDEITLTDEYWDGTDDHDKVKRQILEREFTIEPTKYLTLKADVNYIDFQRQLIYMMGLIVDSRVDNNDLTVGVPSIYEGVPFKLTDLFLFICLLNNLEMDLSQLIIRPEDVEEEKTIVIPDYEPVLGGNDWWLREVFPELFINYEYRVFGFNPEADLNKVNEVINRKWTNFEEKTYSLADFGCDTFIVPNMEITTFEQLCDIYETNMKCYDKLNDIICHLSDNEFELLLAKYIYRELFTKEFDYTTYNGYTNLDDVLRGRNYILWSFYKGLTIISDKESRNRDIQSVLNDIVLALEYYLDRDSLDYFFSFASTANFTSIIKYIYLMCNTFKSYKAHFIEPTIRYKFLYPDVLAGNYAEIADSIINRTSSFSKFDKEYIHDRANKIVSRKIDISEKERYMEILDIFNGYDPDPDDDYIYDGGEPDTSDYIKDLDGTEVNMSLPYRTLDGGFPYGRHGLTKYQVNGKDEYMYDLESKPFSEVNGDDIMYDESFMHSDDYYFTKFFDHSYNGGTSKTNYIVNNNFFKRVYDYQDKQSLVVSARTGLEYSEDKDTGEVILKEIWREWLSITEFEFVKSDPEIMLKLMDNNEFWEYYRQFLEDLDHEKIKVFLDELEQKKNRGIGIDLSLTDIHAEDNKNVPWDWDYGDLDDPKSGNEKLDISNYENQSLSEYDFEDIDNDSVPENVHHNYNFGDNDLSRILWIEDIYNFDTSRIITYNI